MSLKKIYCLSGIGADKRIFEFIDIPDAELVHISWLPPLQGEGLEQYAKRLSTSIKEENFLLAGVSFGGMIATEIAKLYPAANVLIFSSAKTCNEVPFYFKLFKWLPLYKILPDGMMHQANALSYYFFGARTAPVKKIMQAIMKDTNASFIRWAMGAILKWENKIKPANLYHVHGNRDLILPLNFVRANEIVEDGTHLMILEKASLIKKYFERLIKTNENEL